MTDQVAATPRWSLLDEPWIVVLTTRGSTETVSLRDLFRTSAQIADIVGDIPTQGFAILRLALAVVARAVDGPATRADWLRLWQGGDPPLDLIEVYLDRHAERFDLFHPVAPFFQVADLHTARNEFSGLEKLIADVPSRYPYFTTRLGRGLGRLTPAEATRWLVHLQAFDASGIKSGAVGDERVKGGRGYPIGTGFAGYLGGLYVTGENLWRTLLLNTVPLDQRLLLSRDARDRPAWEAGPPGPAEASDLAQRPYGPLDLFTWQSRRVRLRHEPDGTVTGVIVANGDRLTPALRERHEPMSAWRRSRNQEKKLGVELAYMPQQHQPARALWRGLSTVLPLVAPNGRGDGGEPYKTAAVVEWAAEMLDGTSAITLRAIGMAYRSMESIVDDVVDDRLTLRVAVLSHTDRDLPDTVVDSVEATEKGVQALRSLAANLTRAAGGTDDTVVSGARDRAAERAYAALDAPFRSWLRGLGSGPDPQLARIAWHGEARDILWAIGLELVVATGPDAWVGRQHNGRRITSPEAEGWFRSALAAALPVPSPSAPTHDSSEVIA